jgi:hypothetical protein
MRGVYSYVVRVAFGMCLGSMVIMLLSCGKTDSASGPLTLNDMPDLIGKTPAESLALMTQALNKAVIAYKAMSSEDPDKVTATATIDAIAKKRFEIQSQLLVDHPELILDNLLGADTSSLPPKILSYIESVLTSLNGTLDPSAGTFSVSGVVYEMHWIGKPNLGDRPIEATLKSAVRVGDKDLISEAQAVSDSGSPGKKGGGGPHKSPAPHPSPKPGKGPKGPKKNP